MVRDGMGRDGTGDGTGWDGMRRDATGCDAVRCGVVRCGRRVGVLHLRLGPDVLGLAAALLRCILDVVAPSDLEGSYGPSVGSTGTWDAHI